MTYDNEKTKEITAMSKGEAGVSISHISIESAMDSLDLYLSLDYRVIEINNNETRIVLESLDCGDGEDDVKTTYETFEGRKKTMKKLIRRARKAIVVAQEETTESICLNSWI